MVASSPQAGPFDMVIVGATGDLARRKLLPALFFLHKSGALPQPGRLIAVARHEMSREAYLERAEESVRRYVDPVELTPEAWGGFAERLHYVRLQATEPATHLPLEELLAEGPERARIFYLATPPDLYSPISNALKQSGLVTPKARIVLEKPIGNDLASAEAINDSVGRVFDEHEIFRIDHYLGKEAVQNLMAIRFGNSLFEPMWWAERIDHVQITVAEEVGVEGRGRYYDGAGAMRDMVQNHLLQLLCLVAMEPPTRLQSDMIRHEKLKVLYALRPITGSEVERKTVRGQYRAGALHGLAVPGYPEEEGIPTDSLTETFVALKVAIDNWRWAGVPFYLRTGKRLQKRVSEIVIQFKKVPYLLFDARGFEENRLVIRLQPDEHIKLAMMMKVPGGGMVLRPADLDLNLADTFDGRTPDAYERLLLDVVKGNPTLFMRRDEVEQAWRWVEPILQGWEESGERPRPYVAGTWGPLESAKLIDRDGGRSWYEESL